MSTAYTSSVNALGMRAVRLHYQADPEKNAQHADPVIAARARAWLDRARRLYPDPAVWAQEMEINWWIATGTRVYPEFLESLHTLALDGFRAYKVIYRAWDFGWHAPGCLIAQLDTKDRLILMKEVIGREQTTRDFAQSVLDRCAEWFPLHQSGFIDFCDPTGQKVSSSAAERSEARDVEILQALGIFPKWEWGWSRKDGRGLVHQLLRPRSDDTPSLYVNPTGCPVLLQGFLGKYVYPPKKGGGAHDEPDENSHPWADIHACLRYLATGLYSALGLRKVSQTERPAKRVTWQGYGSKKARTAMPRRVVNLDTVRER